MGMGGGGQGAEVDSQLPPSRIFWIVKIGIFVTGGNWRIF